MIDSYSDTWQAKVEALERVGGTSGPEPGDAGFKLPPKPWNSRQGPQNPLLQKLE